MVMKKLLLFLIVSFPIMVFSQIERIQPEDIVVLKLTNEQLMNMKISYLKSKVNFIPNQHYRMNMTKKLMNSTN